MEYQLWMLGEEIYYVCRRVSGDDHKNILVLANLNRKAGYLGAESVAFCDICPQLPRLSGLTLAGQCGLSVYE